MKQTIQKMSIFDLLTMARRNLQASSPCPGCGSQNLVRLDGTRCWNQGRQINQVAQKKQKVAAFWQRKPQKH